MFSLRRCLFLLILLGAFSVSGGCGDQTLVVGRVGALAGAPATPTCAAEAEMCAFDVDCCFGACREGKCSAESSSCAAEGSECQGALDCCSLACVEGRCRGECVMDTVDCRADAECCSGSCKNGRCDSFSRGCKTSGNSCSGDSECCSQFCRQGICSPLGSYCSQEGDVCGADKDCCSRSCIREEGGVLGVCAAAPSGPSNCSGGIAGTICSDCRECCSRLCASFGTSGKSVCQGARGCRQTGELCASDTECCGAAGTELPGEGNVTCVMEEGSSRGVCRNAMSCSPQGNVCHIRNAVCGVSAAANKCCSAEGEEGVCELDVIGVPRCNGLGAACRVTGETCASELDCCSGSCLPNEDATALVCVGNDQCAGDGERCSSTADCCPELSCAGDEASTFGRCEAPDRSVSCSLLGQSCGNDVGACCPGSSCAEGTCVMQGAP